jgi:hypothetical protein
MALSIAIHEPNPPRLALITAGLRPFVTMKSMASINQEKLPNPLSASIFTA